MLSSELELVTHPIRQSCKPSPETLPIKKPGKSRETLRIWKLEGKVNINFYAQCFLLKNCGSFAREVYSGFTPSTLKSF